jgi:hypothetical protein
LFPPLLIDETKAEILSKNLKKIKFFGDLRGHSWYILFYFNLYPLSFKNSNLRGRQTVFIPSSTAGPTQPTPPPTGNLRICGERLKGMSDEPKAKNHEPNSKLSNVET